ncbi:MAG: hypothetical protein GVY36_10740 [Verrucomicrobia bacterium]|jgi:hypothetical protein|nr:hypothetical protein [Verrucomicrobiota bacterium]
MAGPSARRCPRIPIDERRLTLILILMNIAKIKGWSALKKRQLAVRLSLARGHPPVLVHQMGKVGSTSLIHALRGLRGLPPVCQTHFLTLDGISEAKAIIRGWGIAKANHLEFSDFVATHVRARKSSGPSWQVITIVRDPVARQLSDIYQNPGVVGEAKDGIPSAERVLEYLTAYFHEFDESTDFVCRWFQHEFIDLFDFPVYEQSFPYEQGYEIFEGGNVRALVLRLEDFPGVIDDGEALGAFFGREIPAKISQRNAAHDRDSFNSYDAAKSKLKIPRSDLEKIYSTAFARHFYSDCREALITRWAGE